MRFGEMEKDCILSHGSAFIAGEKLFDHSDNYTLYRCTKCGSPA